MARPPSNAAPSRARRSARARWLAGALLFVVGACEEVEAPPMPPDEPPEPAATAALCGREGPVRVLALEHRSISAGGVRRFGDRLVVQTRANEGPEVWSVGLCGEDPRLLSDSLLGDVMVAPPWPDAPLVRREAGSFAAELVALDPRGVAPAQVLTDDLSSIYETVAAETAGIFTYSWGDGYYFSLEFRRYVEADAPGLEPGVDLTPDQANDALFLDNEVFLRPLVDEPDLIGVSLVDFSQTAALSDVDSFTATSSHLLYTSGGELRLRDRATNSEQSATLTAGAVTLTLDAETATASVEDPEGSPFRALQAILIDLETGAIQKILFARVVGRAPDGRFALVSDTAALLVDPRTGDIEPLGGEVISFSVAQLAADGVLLGGAPGSTSRLRLVPYDGGGEVLLAERARAGFSRLRDGRVVTTLDPSHGLADLVVVDRGGLVERPIDTHVVDPREPLVVPGALDPDVVAYEVRDGERGGLYLVNLGDAALPDPRPRPRT